MTTQNKTIRLTMAQALVRYLAALRVESGEPLFGGAFAIFGHGNVAGLAKRCTSIALLSRPIAPTMNRRWRMRPSPTPRPICAAA